MSSVRWARALTLVALVAGASAARAEAAPSQPTPPAASLEQPQGRTYFRSYDTTSGLRNLVVVAIAQDAGGTLWVGTDEGAYRYDGARFTRYVTTEGLPSSQILSLGLAPDGQLCAGTTKGVACWNGRAFTAIAHVREPVRVIASGGGRMWLGTASRLLVRGDDGRFVPAAGWPREPALAVNALHVDASGIVAARDGTLLTSTGDGVWRELAVGLPGERIDCILRDRSGSLWLRSAVHMWELPRGADQVIDRTGILPPSYDGTQVPNNLAEGPDGAIWAASDNGLSVREGDSWRVINRSGGLPGTGARTVFVDREGTVWAGGVGLFERRGRGLIERFDADRNIQLAWSFARDPAGALWIGTNACLVRQVAGAWICLPGSEDRVVRAVVFPPQGGVFLAGAPSELVYIDPAGIATKMPLARGNPAEHGILALALAPDGDLWLGTRHGLFRLRGAVPGPLERITVPHVPDDTVYRSLRVIDGRMWTATEHGAHVHDADGWRTFGIGHGFLDAELRYLVPVSGDRICVAYVEAIGLSCFASDGRSIGALRHIGMSEGLGTGMVYFIGSDTRGRLWVGTGDGVDVFSDAGVEHFAQRDGLAGDDAAAMAFHADTDGSVWMGSTGGATHFRAQDYDGPPPPPHALIRHGHLGALALGVDHAAPLSTPHDRSALAIELGVDSLRDLDRVQFAVRLSPLEGAWAQTHLREARYPALQPGSYLLEVRARIGAGAWGPVTQLHFVVRPAWWQTGWFYVLAGVGVVIVLALVIGWRQRLVLRQRTRQLQAQSDAKLRALLDSVPELVGMYRDGVLTYLNRAARQLFANQAGEVGHPLHPDDLAAHDAMLRDAREIDAARPPDAVELRLQGRDGRWRVFEVSCVRMQLDGEAVLVTTGRDATERHRMRAKLMISDRMASLGTLAAGIAHEINNPLAYVIGNLEVLAESAEASRAPADMSAVIRDAADGAERVRRIVQGLRSFTRTEEEERVALDLAEVLEGAIRMTANEVRHRADLVRELSPTPPVVGDNGRLTQVFINLIVNAAHAIPEGHFADNRITVRTRGEGATAVIEISDTGHGMPPEVQARVFDPFFTTKGIGAGTGLGLSICHGIVTSLGGQIAIDSTPGRGTTVRVSLPAASREATTSGAPSTHAAALSPAAIESQVDSVPVAAAVEAASPASPVAPVVGAAAPSLDPPSRPRVLLVDDEPLVAEMLRRALRRDYDVTVVSCGQSALDEIARGAWFDAIISDVMMPNMTGLALLDELRRIAPDQATRLMFLSGGVFSEETRQQLDAGGTPQLEKPIGARDLRAAVHRVAHQGTAPLATVAAPRTTSSNLDPDRVPSHP